MSIVFLVYVYLVVLRRGQQGVQKMRRTFSAASLRIASYAGKLNRKRTDTQSQNSGSVSTGRTHGRNVSYSRMAKHETGSFYLRLGAVGKTTQL
jgi:hypothetical protein